MSLRFAYLIALMLLGCGGFVGQSGKPKNQTSKVIKPTPVEKERVATLELMNKAELPKGGQVSDHHLKWVPYDEGQIEIYKAEGRPVFINFTADWCRDCKLFEAQFLNTATMAARFAERGVVPMKADLTRSDIKLWNAIKRLRRTGIPVYVLYPVNGEVQLLPEGAPLSLTEHLLGLPLYDAPNKN